MVIVEYPWLMTLFLQKIAKLTDNIAIYGITVLTKKATLQILLKEIPQYY